MSYPRHLKPFPQITRSLIQPPEWGQRVLQALPKSFQPKGLETLKTLVEILKKLMRQPKTHYVVLSHHRVIQYKLVDDMT